PFEVAAADAFGEHALERRLGARRGDERLAGHVVDHLRVDVRHAPEHRQTRPLLGARDPLALAKLNPLAPIGFRRDLHFAPVLPAFFLSTSPVYRPPFRLYGYGLRSRRYLAATYPPSCRAASVTAELGCVLC